MFGIILLFISCTISSLKGIITKYLLSGEEPLSTFQLLSCVGIITILLLIRILSWLFLNYFLSQLLMIICFINNGFQSIISIHILLSSSPWSSILILICCGFLAFLLNVANFNAVKEGGPLMMNVVGNVKQVAMIFISLFLFGNKIKPIGLLGSAICIAGSMWYTYGKND